MYYIHPYAIYKGIEFDAIMDKKNQKVNLGTTDAKIAKKLAFKRTDKYYYEKWIQKDEVQLIERRKEIDLELL